MQVLSFLLHAAFGLAFITVLCTFLYLGLEYLFFRRHEKLLEGRENLSYRYLKCRNWRSRLFFLLWNAEFLWTFMLCALFVVLFYAVRYAFEYLVQLIVVFGHILSSVNA